jgi:subtilisin family serine protease
LHFFQPGLHNVCNSSYLKGNHHKNYIYKAETFTVEFGDNNLIFRLILIITEVMESPFQYYDESVNYFGMHVKDAWDKGYNGSGVTIAVIDIGIIADIDDIRKNLVQKTFRNI